MRILVFHGYLLRGTGSNVYNAELARALAAAGHEVHLLCQDIAPAQLAFVDAVGEWNDEGVLAVESLTRPRPDGWGHCTVYRPPIGRILPVYVADRYEGFEALTFDQLDDDQLNHYIAANVGAVRDVAAIADVQCALANHLVMGPAILARALPDGLPYAVKIHGSALEYTVRPHPRFMPYAEEGVRRAATVLVGSAHTANRLWETLPACELEPRTFLGPPGVDIAAFRPRDRQAQLAGLATFENELESRERSGYDAVAAEALDRVLDVLVTQDKLDPQTLAARLSAIRSGFDPAGIDALAPAAAAELQTHDGPLVLYVGKLIASKGVELLLAALPLVAERVPGVRLAVAGFGTYREGLELLLRALAAGELELARWLALAGRELEGGESGELTQLTAFLDSLTGDDRERYLAASAGLRERVLWFGRIEHDLLVHPAAAADVQVVPSTFPEAFGMVAAEAAACGVVPVCAHHSGLAEVTDQLAVGLDAEDAALMSFETGPEAVHELAERLIALLGDTPRRQMIGNHAAAVAARRFSWEGVAAGVAQAARGDHHELRRPV